MARASAIVMALFSYFGLQNVLAFNAPPDVPTWCGKPYMSRYVQLFLLVVMFQGLRWVRSWLEIPQGPYEDLKLYSATTFFSP